MAEPIYSFSANVIGAKELAAACANAKSFAAKAYSDAINKTAYQFEKLAREKAPHLKGGLRSSIHTDSQPGHLAVVTQNNIEAVVGTNLDYARAQELGTQGMVIHSRSKLGKPFNYIGNIKPKYYFRDAKDEVKPLLTDNLEEAVRRVLNSLATKGVAI